MVHLKSHGLPSFPSLKHSYYIVITITYSNSNVIPNARYLSLAIDIDVQQILGHVFLVALVTSRHVFHSMDSTPPTSALAKLDGANLVGGERHQIEPWP